MEDQCHGEYTIPHCRPSLKQLGKRGFCLLYHLLLSTGTAPRHSVLSPTRAQQQQSIRFSLGARATGEVARSSALCSDAPTCCPGTEPSVFASQADLHSSARPLAGAGRHAAPQGGGSPGGKPPAGMAVLCRSYFAKTGELKVTLKMEGDRSVT